MSSDQIVDTTEMVYSFDEIDSRDNALFIYCSLLFIMVLFLYFSHPFAILIVLSTIRIVLQVAPFKSLKVWEAVEVFGVLISGASLLIDNKDYHLMLLFHTISCEKTASSVGLDFIIQYLNPRAGLVTDRLDRTASSDSGAGLSR